MIISYIDLKYTPAYWWLIISIPTSVLVLYALLFSPFHWSFIFLGAIAFALLYSNLTSFKKTIRVACDDDGYLIFWETNLIRESGYRIKLGDVQKIWTYRFSVNFIPMGTSFKCLIAGKKIELFSVADWDGYLSQTQRTKFLNFIHQQNPNIRFGY
ncbi:MAG TPA: hypothetical protein VI757_15945 [Bacteroidia bacterium]|nr:hypothetical protein [Bacteroidia bacterium]